MVLTQRLGCIQYCNWLFKIFKYFAIKKHLRLLILITGIYLIITEPKQNILIIYVNCE